MKYFLRTHSTLMSIPQNFKYTLRFRHASEILMTGISKIKNKFISKKRQNLKFREFVFFLLNT